MSRVLLVIDQIRTGGAEKILLDFKNYLLRNGYEVSVFSLYASSGADVCGCEKNNANIVAKCFQQFNLYFKFRRYVRSVRPDYIFSFLDRSNILVALLPLKYRRCLSVHNILSIQYAKLHPWTFRWVRWIIGATYNRNGNTVVAVSEQVKTDLIQKFGVKPTSIEVVTNRTDKSFAIERSSEEINEVEWDAEYKYILNIGRFSEQKAQWKLLKALRYLHDKVSEQKVKLILLGEGPLRDQLAALADALEISHLVHILPFNSNPFKFMKRADLFVLPSIFEGCPIVLSEAIALNTPFVGSREAVPRELFGEMFSVWNDSTFCNTHLRPDFTTSILSDDMELAELIQKHLNGACSSIVACRNWNRFNDKIHQFEAYMHLFERP